MCFGNKIHNKNSDNSVIKHPIRKSRTKRRRPKFLSLQLELISPQISPMSHDPSAPAVPPPQKQLSLFPLHPEDAAVMFENDVVSRTTCRPSFLSSHQNDRSSEEEEAVLVRTAMRSREREAGAEEKWVCYSEVVEKKEEPSWTAAEEEEVEEVTSTAVDTWQLFLKLDYEGILNAWSDKAPLFINGESPQIVPNLHDHPILCTSDSLPNGSESGNMWRVSEINIGWKMGQKREASVLRYKQKRQNRLASNRIRYQVRKLNADKRPRIKGRFVKRS